MKVFIASASAAERAALAARLSESGSWQVVSDPAWADVVILSTEEWARLNPDTVKFHLGAIFGKLGASTRTEAVRRGLSLGVIDI